MINKRGVSPLIATVLLVMIVVSIGAAVMVVIQGLAQEGIQSTEQQQALIRCGTDVEVGLLTVSDSYRMCINITGDTNTFTLYLENTGQRDISDWKIRVVVDGGVNETNGGFSALPKGSLLGFSFPFNADVGDTIDEISKIVLYPKIPGGPSNPAILCSEPNLEWDEEEIQEMTNCQDVTWDDNI